MASLQADPPDTLCELLRDRWRRKNHSDQRSLRKHEADLACGFSWSHYWDDIAQLTSIRESAGHRLFKGDKGVGSPDAPDQPAR